VRAAITVGAALPPDPHDFPLSDGVARGVRAWLIVGEEDRFRKANEALHTVLREGGATCRLTVVPSLGHDLPTDLPERLHAGVGVVSKDQQAVRMCRTSRHERLSKSLHDAQQADEGHWTAAPGNRTGNLPAGACSLKVTADSREAAIGSGKGDDHQRAVSQHGRYDHDRRPTRIPGDRADQAADQPQQQEPAKGARLNTDRECRPAAAGVPCQGYQLTGESLLDPDPPINRPDQQADRKRRKPRDPRHAPESDRRSCWSRERQNRSPVGNPATTTLICRGQAGLTTS
jgi:hypothetical protein